MSEPVHSYNVQIVGGSSNIPTDMTVPINSLAVNLDSIVSYSIQAIFSGSPAGSLQLQSSDDTPLAQIPAANSWTVITDSVQGISAAGTYVVNVELPAYSFVRLQWIPTGGSGTLNVRINAKRR